MHEIIQNFDSISKYVMLEMSIKIIVKGVVLGYIVLLFSLWGCVICIGSLDKVLMNSIVNLTYMGSEKCRNRGVGGSSMEILCLI